MIATTILENETAERNCPLHIFLVKTGFVGYNKNHMSILRNLKKKECVEYEESGHFNKRR